MRKTTALIAAAFAGTASSALAHDAGGLPHLHQGAEMFSATPAHASGVGIVALGVVLALCALARLLPRDRSEDKEARHE